MRTAFLVVYFVLAAVATFLLAALFLGALVSREESAISQPALPEVPSGSGSLAKGGTMSPLVSEPAIPERSLPLPAPSLVVTVKRATSPPTRSRTNRTVKGMASTYGPGYSGFLALPEGPGHRVRICGRAACVTKVSNDAGPSKAMQRKGRVVDLDVATFERVCGCSWRKVGLTPVRVEYLR